MTIQWFKLISYWLIIATVIFRQYSFVPGFFVALIGSLGMFIQKIRLGVPMSPQFIVFESIIHSLPLILAKELSFKDTGINALLFITYCLFFNPFKVYNDVIQEDADYTFIELLKQRQFLFTGQ
jgi:hypothetical protein